MTARNYDACLSKTLGYEGGYSNDAGDPGGPTKYGITIADVRKYLNPRADADDVKRLTLDQAKVIYRAHYWNVVDGDELADGVDLAVFDYGVNSGTSRSIKVLQGFVSADVDGEIGPETVSKSLKQDAKQLVKSVCKQRLSFLRGLGTFSIFGKGWTKRVVDVEATGVKMAGASSDELRREAAGASKKSGGQSSAAGAAAGGAAVTQQDVFAALGHVGVWCFWTLVALAVVWAAYHAYVNHHRAAAYDAAAAKA